MVFTSNVDDKNPAELFWTNPNTVEVGQVHADDHPQYDSLQVMIAITCRYSRSPPRRIPGIFVERDKRAHKLLFV